MKKKKTNDQKDLSRLSQKEIKEMWSSINTAISGKKPKKNIQKKPGGDITLTVIFCLTSLLVYHHLSKWKFCCIDQGNLWGTYKNQPKFMLQGNTALTVDRSFHNQPGTSILKENAIFEVTGSTQYAVLPTEKL